MPFKTQWPYQKYKLENHNYKTIVNSVLTRSSQSASLTNTKMPGLLQTETFFHNSTIIPEVLRKTKRMLTKTEIREKFLIFTGHNVLSPWGGVILELLHCSNQERWNLNLIMYWPCIRINYVIRPIRGTFFMYFILKTSSTCFE